MARPKHKESTNLKLVPERDGFVVDEQVFRGFPHLPELSDDQQLRVARWAFQLTPDKLTPEQHQLLEAGGDEPNKRQQRTLAQERYLSSPLVRTLWRRLTEEQRRRVLNPEDWTGGAHYPLRPAELGRLTGLSTRQIRYWSDRRLLRHSTNARGHRFFELPAAVVAFALADRKQHERQFYADIGHISLSEMRTVLSLVGVPLLDATSGADGAELAELESLLEDVLSTVRAQRIAVAV